MMNFFKLRVLLAACCVLSTVAVADDVPLAWQDLGALSRATLDSPAAVEGRRIEPLPASLLRDAGALILPLPEGDLLVHRSGLSDRGAEQFHWLGHVDGFPQHTVSLTAHGGHLLGLIYAPDATWELALGEGAVPVLQRLDQTLFPECDGGIDADDAQPSPPQKSFSPIRQQAVPGSVTRNTRVDPDDQIDLLILYTPQVLAFFGGSHLAAQAHGQAAIDNSNTAFSNSLMTPRFRIAGNLMWDREESSFPGTNSSAVLSTLRDDAWVNQTRNQYRADMVGLLVENGRGGCGVGYVMRNPGAGFAPSAYQVTARSCAVGNLTYAHEHGHNMGFEHDPANGTSPSNASFPWSFGHFVSGSYRTVMSYSNQCSGGCTRRMYFSNPNVSFMDAPTGIENERDNARSGNAVAGIIANFRLSAPDAMFATGFEEPVPIP